MKQMLLQRVLVTSVLAASIAVLSGCAGMRGTRSVASSATDNARQRDARLLEMIDQRRADTALVDALLADPDPVRRARATLAIGQIKLRARYPRLRLQLLDGDTAIAANAAYALGIARDTGSVTALARALAGAPDPVAREAAWSLGEIGEPSRAVLHMALGEGQATPLTGSPMAHRAAAVRAAVVLAAVKLRPAPVALVTPWLADSAAEVVRSASYVVGRLRSPAGVRAVLAVQAHPDEEVRQLVARALTRAVVGDSLTTQAHSALRRFLRDSSERVRVHAVQGAASFGTVLAADIEPLYRDRAANVRVALAEAFADVGAQDLARWQRFWEADTLLATRRLLLQHARQRGLALWPGQELRWAANADWRYRVAALGNPPAAAGAAGAAAVPDRGPRADTSVARQLVADSEWRVRRVARARLGIRDSAGARTPRTTAAPPRPFSDYLQLVERFWTPGRAQPRAYIDTDHGTITLELLAREAPLVVEAFVRLAQEGRYRNTTFHRVVPNFVVQDGDVGTEGREELGFSLRESWTRQRHGRGCLGLATAGPDTGGSQYYMCHASQPHLDGGYTVFGRVVEGFDVMDRIVQGDRMLQVRVP